MQETISVSLAEDLARDRTLATLCRGGRSVRVRIIGVHADSYVNGSVRFHVRYVDPYPHGQPGPSGQCDIASYEELSDIGPEMKLCPGFQVTEGKGIALKLDNGYEVSIQWGPKNYCVNRSENQAGRTMQAWFRDVGELGSPNAEVYVYDPDGDPVWESPKEYQTPNEVLEILNEIAEL